MSAAQATVSQLSVVDLRELRGADLRPLLESQGGQWRSRYRWDFAPTVHAILSFLDNRTLHGYALVKSGRPVGYCYFVLDHNKALLGDIFISSEVDDPPAERALLVRTLETAAAFPGVHRVEGQLLGLSSEIGPELIFNRRIRVFPRWFMMNDQVQAFRSEREEPPRYAFSLWGDHYLAPAADLIETSYRNHDDSVINDQYREASGARRFLANTTRHTSCGPFLSSASWVAAQSGRAALSGVCLATQVDERVGHVTQICVAPTDRNQGVGRELLRRTLTSLKAHGCQAASLTVTASNAGALRLYDRLGFRPIQRFSAFVWESSPL